MRFAAFRAGGHPGVAVLDGQGNARGLTAGQSGYPGPIDGILQSDRAGLEAYAASLRAGDSIDLGRRQRLDAGGRAGQDHLRRAELP